METVGVEPTPPSLQARRSAELSYIPRHECGRVESNHHSARRQGYSLLSSPVLSVRIEGAADRIRTGTARITTSDAAVTPRPP